MGERHTIEVNGTVLGNTVALASAEGVMADMRASIGGDALREAHRAGFDIGQSKAIYTTLKDGNPALEIEMIDLADLAEQPEGRVDA